jgi:hypothetical protein
MHALALAAVVLTSVGIASSAAAGPLSPKGERDLVEGGYGGFLASHPDLRHYRHGLLAYLSQDYAKAMRHFRIAARHADKPSQALIGEMLWEGQGVAADRALAYAWLDLAAERGQRRFVLQRERYWNVLDDAERAEALARGEALYAEFGDAVAQPRMARALRRGMRHVAGSRTGFGGNTRIHAAAVGSFAAPVPTNTGGTEDTGMQPGQVFAAASFFTPRLWRAEQYFDWRDGYFERQLGMGTVEVGEMRRGSDPGADASRALQSGRDTD